MRRQPRQLLSHPGHHRLQLRTCGRRWWRRSPWISKQVPQSPRRVAAAEIATTTVTDKDGRNIVVEPSSIGSFHRDILLTPGTSPYRVQVSANDGSAAGPFTIAASAGTGDATCQAVPWKQVSAPPGDAFSGTLATSSGDCPSGTLYRDRILVNPPPILRLLDAVTGTASSERSVTLEIYGLGSYLAIVRR